MEPPVTAGPSPSCSPPAGAPAAPAEAPGAPAGSRPPAQAPVRPSGAPSEQADTSCRKSPMMEINSAFTHLPPKPEVNNSSPTLVRPTEANNMANAWHDPARHDALQQQLLQLRQQHELQQRFLVEQFKAQQQQLTEEHEKQLQQHITVQLQQQLAAQYQDHAADDRLPDTPMHDKEYQETQKKREEQQLALEKERREQDRLEQLKKKDVRQQSAVASTEVKQRLQEFVLQKKQREAAAASSPYRNCSNNSSSGRSSLVHQRSTEKANASPHPYRPHVLSKYDDEFCPLRKTASEPNISLKARIKQRVLERCSVSPGGRKLHEQAGRPIKHKSKLTLESSTSTPDSDPSSPPNASFMMTGGRGGTPIQEETGGLPFHLSGLAGSGGPEMSLYSSPSMPNISLGRPPVHTAVSSGSDGEASRPGPYPPLIPIGAPMMTTPFFPILPVIDSECTPPTSPAYIRKQMATLEQVRNPLLGGLYPQHGGITSAEAAQARLGRTIQGRPLSRTQSAPLPLGHPLLHARASLTREQYEELVSDRQRYEQQHQHNLLKQHIRQTVLTRAGSKNQVENVEEETEAAVAREMQDSKDAEVIDLTENRIDLSEAREEPAHQMALAARPPPNSRAHHAIRPLARAFSSPLVTLNPAATASPARDPHITYVSKQGCGTGLVYDPLMLKHQCVCGDSSNHPEHSARLQYIWSRLQETGLSQRCDRIRSRKATLEEIQTCHSEAHTSFFGTNPLNRQANLGKLGELPIRSFVKMPCGGIGVDLDTTWNELHTSSAARMAAGCVSELALKVAMGAVKNGFALVRPPGHHAERQQAMGFCFFNSVAVAARLLRLQLSVEKVMIIDWDVHHGNGTQQLFYDSSHVLYLSLHRHDDGNFFPGTGAPVECGVEDGMGFNVNVAWSGGCSPPMGDAEYLAAFRSIVMPIARDFQPDVLLVSAGFDAARGHPSPLGGYQVSAQCFAWMTRQMMTLANGKVALALEGGYDIPAICDATEHTIRALLGDELQPISDEELNRKPCQAAIDTLKKTVDIQVPHWPCVKRTAHLIPLSHAEAAKERDAESTLSAMAGLTVHHRHHIQPPHQPHQSPPPPAQPRSSPARPVSPTQEEPMDQDDAEAK